MNEDIKIWGLGIGPGDPDLITLKALKILQTVDVVAYPAFVDGVSLVRSIAASHMTGTQEEIVISTPMVVERHPAQDAYDKAAKAAGKFPTTDQVIDALTGATFPTFVGDVRMALGKGHQGVTDDMWGVTTWDKGRGEMVVKDVVKFTPECVMPPAGVKGVDWIKGGMKGAKC